MELLKKLFMRHAAQQTAPPRVREHKTNPGTLQSIPPACPSCGVILDTFPSRTRKCPSCKQKLVVRTRRSDRAKLLLTESQGRVFDTERSRDAKRNKAIRHSLLHLGCSKRDFELIENELARRFGVALPGDTYCVLANSAIKEPMLNKEWHRVGMIQWGMARWLYEEGREHIQMQREAYKADLLHHLSQGRTHVRVVSGSCNECRKNDGRVFSVSDALNSAIIPNERCKNGWCICLWLPTTRY